MQYQLELDSSWKQILNEAKRWQDKGIGCYSISRGNGYWISQIKSSGNEETIVIKREEGKNEATLGLKMLRNFLKRFGDRDFLSTERSENQLDKAQMTVIVYLHDYLAFSEDTKSIVILSEPKVKIGDSRSVNKNSLKDSQRYAREIRMGQPKFRSMLLKAYNNSCCISNTSLVEVLDAAHIEPYAINKNSETMNGLLLRTDIHNLFDDGLIKINPTTLTVHIDTKIQSTEYKQYENVKIASRTDGLNPSASGLQWHWDNV